MDPGNGNTARNGGVSFAFAFAYNQENLYCSAPSLIALLTA